jgi:hypothetical protein
MGNLKIPSGRESCINRLRDKRIALSGKQTSRLYLSNPTERWVEKIQVDGCAITQGLRCDWAVEVDDRVSRKEIFIELKGSHLTHAAKQLAATIVKLSSDPAQTEKRCLIAYERCPLTGPEIKQLQEKFQKKYNATFEPVRNGSSHLL